ncbi:MAG: hypothetical protein NC548_32570 [Lachnospiraceae bacterium]|nr:hypothetical protein [Lachnospiraceae bacterium]
MRTLFLFLLASALCFGCSPAAVEAIDPNAPENPQRPDPKPDDPSEADPTEPEPMTLTAAFDRTECVPDETVAGMLTVTGTGTADGYALATTLLSGTARIVVDGLIVPTGGEWITFSAESLTVAITPDREEDLLIEFRIKNLADECSEPCRVALTAAFPPELTIKASCMPRIENPTPETVHPITLTIDYPKYAGNYTVVPAVAQGAGEFRYAGQPVGPSGIVVHGGTTTIDYRPTVLGKHLLDFEVRAGDAAKQARTDFEVVKIFTIACDVPRGVRISGAGEYRVEGEPVVFAMTNEPNYNFEVAGWYDASGRLLSTESACTITADYTVPTDYRLKLEKREVKFTMGEPYHKSYRYPVLGSNGQIASWKTVYDYRLNLQYDYLPTDDILLYYEKYRWQTTVPPVEQKEWTVESATGYFWRIDNKFQLRIRQSDNPDLVFDRARHAVEAESTRYLLPAEIEMQ